MAIDPELLPFVERHQAAWPVPGHLLPLAQWRATYEQQVAQSRPPRPPDVEVRDAMAGGVPVRIYRPSQRRGTMVYFHGGGWVIGSVDSHDDITADLAHHTGCTVVSVEYSRAPEHAFPKAFEQAWAVTACVATGALDSRDVDGPVVVAGDSAGGNLAAACALAAAPSGVRLAGQLLLYPCLDLDFSRESYRQSEQAPFLTSEQMMWFWAQYARSAEARLDWRAVPMRAGADQLARLPPAFVATAEHDPLRDEGLEYARRLQAAGCKVHLDPGLGLVHGYIRLRHHATQPARIYRDIGQWVRQIVER